MNDFSEISRGTSPVNAADVAFTTDNTTEINCLVGDDSGSTSERWQLTVGGFVVNNSAPGQLISRNIRLKQGNSYPVKLRHLSSILSPPDLDYHIELRELRELRTANEAPPAFLVNDPQQ